MLSTTWETFSQDRSRRLNLFKDLSRVMLSLSKNPLPYIGSLSVNDQGVLRLANRPLTTIIPEVENDGGPGGMDRDKIYSIVDFYLQDLLAYHGARIRHQPNSMISKADGRAQLAALTMIRASMPLFSDPDLRHGPFVLQLTDAHPSNIFVDDDWHIKYLIDLEWACSLPLEMQHPPLWLTNEAIDRFYGEKLDAYETTYEEFVAAFAEVERNDPKHPIQLALKNSPAPQAAIMRKNWMTGSFWYFRTLESPTGLYAMFGQHIEPRFTKTRATNDHFDDVVAPFWSLDALDVIDDRLKAKEAYDAELVRAFERPSDPLEE